MMQILVTGFEPFGGETINPSLELVRRLPEQLGQARLAARGLPTIFGAALTALDAAVRELRPDIVLAVGQAGSRAALSVERVALNIDDARIPDNAGAQPIDRAIVAGGPAAYFSSLPVKAAVAACREAGIPAEVSNTAGTFVCNHVFYGLMHLAATEFPGMRGGFVHIPYLPSQAAHHRGAPSLALELALAGVVEVLKTALARRDDIAAVEGRLD
jgi:pyroglutamyl-peptidase